MKITDYAFGTINIDGATYTSDVIITPDGVNASWWRKQGHLLQIEDLAEIENRNPDTLVIGTGYYGYMEVPQETLAHLKAKGIETHVAKTAEAVKLFNKLQPEAATIVAALHLTC